MGFFQIVNLKRLKIVDNFFGRRCRLGIPTYSIDQFNAFFEEITYSSISALIRFDFGLNSFTRT